MSSTISEGVYNLDKRKQGFYNPQLTGQWKIVYASFTSIVSTGYKNAFKDVACEFEAHHTVADILGAIEKMRPDIVIMDPRLERNKK